MRELPLRRQAEENAHLPRGSPSRRKHQNSTSLEEACSKFGVGGVTTAVDFQTLRTQAWELVTKNTRTHHVRAHNKEPT